MIQDNIRTLGHVEGVIEYKDGNTEVISFKNTILRTGRDALASSLANEVSETYDFYISRMLFGDGGTNGGTPKFVNTTRNGLFGVTRANKPVIASIDPNQTSQAIFTSVLAFEEANGYTINEMALKMSNGDLYSMVTFAGLSKTSEMQITWNWRLNFV